MSNGAFVVTGGPELRRRLTAIGKTPQGLLREAGLRSVAEAKQLVPRRTGTLARTIRIGELTADHVDVVAGGTAQVGYAAAVELGSRAHVIVPRQAKVLAWGGPRTLGGRLRKGGTATHFARRVQHPGTRPHPFLIPGFERALRTVGLGSLVDLWNRAA